MDSAATLCAILAANLKLKGTLFDLPHVVPKAKGFSEYRALFAKAGFRLTRAIPTKVDNWILEAEKL